MERVTLNRYHWVTNRETGNRQLVKETIAVNRYRFDFLDFKPKPDFFSDYWFEFATSEKSGLQRIEWPKWFTLRNIKDAISLVYYWLRIEQLP